MVGSMINEQKKVSKKLAYKCHENIFTYRKAAFGQGWHSLSGMSGKLECKRKRVFQLAKRIREMFSYSTCNELNFYAEVKAMAVLCW